MGLLGLGRTLQQDFNRLAESADTSTPEGLSYVLTGNLFFDGSYLFYFIIYEQCLRIFHLFLERRCCVFLLLL